MESIDRAIRGEPLEGHERLAVLQNLLLDLLSYVEKQEGFRISFGERGRATIEGSHADIISLDNQEIRILHQMPGRIRLRSLACMETRFTLRVWKCYCKSLIT